MEMSSKAARTWHLYVHLSYLFYKELFKIQVLLKSKNEKTGGEGEERKKKKSTKHVKTRVECLRNGSSAYWFLTCRMTVDNKNVIHSNIFVFLNKDNMAPLTFHCEALPIVKIHEFIFSDSFTQILLLPLCDLLPVTGRCVNHRH